MNRSELAIEVAEQHGFSKTQAGEIVNGIFKRLAGALAAGEEVALVGFGRFKPATRAARTAKNPRTGEAVQVPAKTTVKFRAAKELSESLTKPSKK